MNAKTSFFDTINKEISDLNRKSLNKFPTKDVLRIDLHCHDKNSSEPDELMGRILNIPETWLETEKLIEMLRNHKCDTYTITNHNNARSCYELQDKGYDVLTGAEFSCTVPDFDGKIHVLAYGFNPEQEVKLENFRHDIYRFQRYALENNIPTVWAHPLYHYKSTDNLSMEFFDKMSVIFERFEVLNGQRDSWQDLLVKKWVESISEESIRKYEKKFKIKASDFCRSLYDKKMYGGSDSHMGIFTGLTGAFLHVKDLDNKLLTQSRRFLAYDALLNGESAPFGGYNNTEKMTFTFIDYFCQIAMNMKDPGLFRIILHKGSVVDKIIAFLITNGMLELNRHRITMKFLSIFHNSLHGEGPSFIQKLLVPQNYKTIFDEVSTIAEIKRANPDNMSQLLEESLKNIFSSLQTLTFKRLNLKLKTFNFLDPKADFDTIEEYLSKTELPATLHNFFQNKAIKGKEGTHKFNMMGFLDGLTFPFLASFVVVAAHFASSTVMYKSRPMLEKFSQKLGTLHFPKKMLWLSDTFGDNNGISVFLRRMLNEIKKRNLPIDILICSDKIEPEDHLIVMKPEAVYELPLLNRQIRIPNLLQLQEKFREGEYDRVICSTEGPMGLVSLYLKKAYSVPAYFFVHKDWVSFAKFNFGFSSSVINKIRRTLRFFYKSFDKVFVLNEEHHKLFLGHGMSLDKSSVKQTSYWIEDDFKNKKTSKKKVFGLKDNEKVLLFVGDIGKGKGVNELPNIYERIKEFDDSIKLVIVGDAPELNDLKNLMPNALFTGWVENKKMADVYSASDLFVIPSELDSFSIAAVEAMSCACPVIVYNSKPHKSVIDNGKNGYVVNSKEKMLDLIIEHFKNGNKQIFEKAGIAKSKQFLADKVIDNFLSETGLK